MTGIRHWCPANCLVLDETVRKTYGFSGCYSVQATKAILRDERQGKGK
jgi:hypothetical protein